MTARSGYRPLRVVLGLVIALGLVLLGGGAAVALGLGRYEAPGAGSVDAGFSRDMSRHHLQAVEIANLAFERTEDPEIRHMAFDISATQTNQVGRMQGWLSLWGLPPTGGETMAWMGTGEHADHETDMGRNGLMPGMATEEELAELRDMSGTAFDMRFLRLLIRHHQGGLEMGEAAADGAGERAVRSLASTIAETQAAETITMTKMLGARGGAPLPAP